ncbi:MAG TPA: endolytic transglycosylase MltG [Nocardioidaceae bacterium]|nr:endolytic transglycosylase MltG [Nocardioidaceae bacterium]
MSDLGLHLDREHVHRRRRRRRSGLGCLAVLIALAVLAGGAWFAYDRGMEALRDRFDPAPDYTGTGTGSVMVEVQEGDNATDIAQTLVSEDVVKSVEAFTDAAMANPESTGIQVGFYEMKKQMSAESALDVLVDPGNMVQSAVTVPEGYRLEQIVETLAKDTDFSRKQYEKVLSRPDAIGLPPYAKGNAEGYLFPATYMLPPNATPRSILTMMVDRWRQAAEEADLVAAAERLGYTPAELMVVASLVEAESNRDADRGKVARVIYNRLETDATNGLLQIDAAVNYAHDRDLGVALTTEDLEIDSPYNTYKNPGLPPTPIEAPGDAAIEAAANPTEGPWVYYVTVNLRTGETKFTESYDEFLQFKAEYKEYCATQSDNC